jgi:hypothetical protein
VTMNEFLRQAQPDCPSCAGTGIIEGESFPVDNMFGQMVGYEKNPDRVCYCVPIMIIRAPDA